MGTLADVFRLLLDGLKAVGGISETQHAQAHEIVNAHDDNAEAHKPTFSDVERAELDKLLAKQAAAEGSTPAAPVATPGGGFYQEPAGTGG
jgi:hypothetical protein